MSTRPLPDHGTTARAKGRPANGIPRCYCPPCRAAERAYDKRRRYLNTTGRTLRVPAAPVAAHINTLLAAGAGWVQLAELAEVSQSSLSKIRCAQQETVNRTVAARILAIKPGQGIPARRSVPALGAIRRVRALMALGHTCKTIQGTTGLDHTVMHGLVNGHLTTIYASTHNAIADAYRRLATRPGSNARARNRARREGWHGPLAWDDNIDDPDATPDTAEVPDPDLKRDELAVLRREEIWLLATAGADNEEIAARIGVSPSTVQGVRASLRGAKRQRGKQVAA